MYKETYEHIFTPLQVGSVTIPNRLFVAPMVSDFCDDDGMATEQYIAYHEEKAKGGWGLIITEDYAVCKSGRGYITAGLWKDEQIESHRKLTERVHAHGSKIFAQIYHAGRQVHGKVPHEGLPFAPSAVSCPLVQQGAQALTIEQIKTIVSQFGDCALRAKKAGFDGVEIHGGHGYLIAEFMSWHANKRIDEYGGPLPNRMRFPLEVIADIREKCGKDFPVTIRISTEELIRDGRVLEDSIYVAHVLEEAGVDAIHASVGLYGCKYSIVPPLNIDPGWVIRYAEKLKTVVKIPVFTVSRITEPGMAELILSMGRADAVVMGRNSLSDPYLPRKLAEGRPQDINRCIGCIQGCQGRLRNNESIRCLVNPELGYEALHEKQPALNKRRVFVAGGGVAGMEAAIIAAERGHEVTLFEASPALGGQFVLAAVPPSKGNLSSFPAWQVEQLKRLGVEVRLNTPLTKAVCVAEHPDNVIIATGSTPFLPPIPGIDGPRVVLASQVLKGEVACKGKVLMAGGGMVGSETADFLCEYGCSVTIVDMLPEIAAEEIATRRTFLLDSLREHGTRFETSCKILSIDEDGTVTWRRKDGSTQSDRFDYVVVALGSRPVNKLADELEDVVKLSVVGDAFKVSNAMVGVRQAFLAACAVN